ncbi:MAG: PEP-utilizing enzyme [Chitinophagales bacterium]
MTQVKTKFISPYELKTPEGAEGWEEMYPYFLHFHDNLKEREEAKFWFCDSQHWPNVFKPFDAMTVEFAVKCLGQYNTRHYLIPPANGVDYKIHNGYVYMSPVGVEPEKIPDRVPQFMERAGHYFANWNDLVDNWRTKVKGVIDTMESINFEALPEVVPMEDIKSGKGLDPTFDLMNNYNKMIEMCYKAWQYHFEFLNLGYAAYLDFFGFCKETFPDIPDLSISKMVQGVDVDLFKPDEEIQKLARLAVKLGVTDAFQKETIEGALVVLNGTEEGRTWADAWEAAKDPWFNYTSGNGFYSSDKYWIEHLDIPYKYLKDYIVRVQNGETIERPTEKIAAERERITAEYRDLIFDDEAKAAFEGKLGLARVVFPYVEDHNFYIEHWSMGVFWRKMRQLATVLKDAGFWAERDDMFYLKRNEISEVLFDYGNAWAVGVTPIGPHYLPELIARRKKMVEKLNAVAPEPAFNKPPEVITEPFTIMLWGITTDSVNNWLKGNDDPNKLTGMAASPGDVEGIARIINTTDDLDLLQQDEILVTRVTAPSWAPVFGKIKATVTDIGGMMSHAAIVCREYGLPAVTGTGSGTTTIKTGQRIRVNGSTGEVTIL